MTDPRQPAAVLTAAGRRLDTSQARAGSTRKIAAAEWQTEAWAYRDSIGEIRFAMMYLAEAASRVRLVPALTQPDGADPRPLSEVDDEPGLTPQVRQSVADAFSRLTGGSFNFAPILAPLAENLEVPGECYLVGYMHPEDDAGVERWEIRSLQEITASDEGYKLVEGPHDREGIPLGEDSYVARLWHPHPQLRSLPDSPMRSLLGPCEQLLLAGRMERAAMRSRFATAGILLLPDSMTFQGTGTALAGQPDQPEDPSSDAFMQTLIQAVTASITDEGDASAVVPIVLKANAEAIAAAKHLTFDRPVDPSLADRADRALRRIAQGLDVPPEVILGMADMNHWTAWQVDAATITKHVGGLLRRMVDALTAGYLRPMLGPDGYGVDPTLARRIVMWYDLSPLASRPDRAQDAKDGHAAGVLSDKVLVEALQFDPDTDMPDDEERARRLALTRGTVDGPTTNVLLELLLRLGSTLPVGSGPSVPGEVVEPAPIEPAPAPAEEPATPGPTSGLPASGELQRARLHSRASRRLARIDQELRAHLTGAADAAVSRAVEKAAARVRSQANKDAAVRASLAAAGHPTESIVAALGLDVEALLAGAFDGLAATWTSWTTSARIDALAVAADMAGVELSSTTAAAAAMEESAQGALAWLLTALRDAAVERLFDPASEDGVADDAEEAGEDPSSAGQMRSLVRGALALAGGLAVASAGVRRDGTAAAPGERLGGIATGGTVSGFLADRGVEDVGYEWVYGVSRRPFEPHRKLDGVVFHDFDSAALRNPGGWPGPTLAPGDHKGCNCDAMPVYGDAVSPQDMTSTGGEAAEDEYMAFLRVMAEDDLASGRMDTTPIRTLMEAERVANVRPSQPRTPTPISDAVRGARR